MPNAPRRRAVSSAQVARLADVSRAQVSNYFNRPDLVSKGTSEKIAAAVSRLGYVPNATARKLRRGHSEDIGVVLVDAWAPFFDQVSHGIESEADAHGWTAQFSNSRRSVPREARLIEQYEAQMTQGVIIFPISDVSVPVRRLVQNGVAVALLDPPHATMTDAPAPFVAVDHTLGGRLAAAHLYERGSRRPAFVGDPHSIEHVADRFAGFQQVIRERLAHYEPHVYGVTGLTVGSGREAAGDILRHEPQDRPDAIFAANDLVALGLLQALTASGLSVPGDVAILGYDDVELASQITPALSTIRQPAAQLGTAAARLVIKLSAGDQLSDEEARQVLTPELIVRHTT